MQKTHEYLKISMYYWPKNYTFFVKCWCNVENIVDVVPKLEKYLIKNENILLKIIIILQFLDNIKTISNILLMHSETCHDILNISTIRLLNFMLHNNVKTVQILFWYWHGAYFFIFIIVKIAQNKKYIYIEIVLGSFQ